ncbi:flagellar brake protein [bacterium]|nr:flagellar brake protein [bacterium]
MKRPFPVEKLCVGQEVLLERHVGRGKRKACCRLIGALAPHYLLLEMPIEDGQTLLMPYDKECVVRLISNGSALGFRATVEKIHYEPFPMVVLRYPNEFQEVLVRSTDRVGCSIPATLSAISESRPDEKAEEQKPDAESSPEGGEKESSPDEVEEECPTDFHGLITDLSQGGCQLTVKAYRVEEVESPGGALLTGRSREEETYSLDLLESLFSRGRRLLLDFVLPPPVEKASHGILGEIRWQGSQYGCFLLGVQFKELQEQESQAIARVIEVQRKYFSPENHTS